jgi:uncharacterized membrane protein
MFKKIKTNLLTGFLIIVPLILTFWVFYFIISKLNLVMLEPIMRILKLYFSPEYLEFLPKVLILVLFLILLVVIGFAARIIVVRNIFGFGEKILYKLPMVRTLYGTFKEISIAFLGNKESIFKKVVMVEYPSKGMYSIGFVTSEEKGELQEKSAKNLINIFVPTSPNPTTGMIVLIPENEIIHLDMSVAEGMKMIISAGAVVPKKV